jgi:hypothetical protein
MLVLVALVPKEATLMIMMSSTLAKIAMMCSDTEPEFVFNLSKNIIYYFNSNVKLIIKSVHIYLI